MILLHKVHFAPIMLAFCFLLLPSYYAPNFASKIDASLSIIGHLPGLLDNNEIWSDTEIVRSKNKGEPKGLSCAYLVDCE